MRIEVFMAENNDKTVVLEGMYKGVEGKLDEVKQSVCKELQFSTAQQASAYESLETLFKQTVDTIIAEVRYLSQQNSAIYDFSKTDRNAVRDEILRDVQERTGAIEKSCVAGIENAVKALNERLESEISGMKDEIARLGQIRAAAAPQEGTVKNVVTEFDVDYDRLAEKLVKRLPAVDYDEIERRVKQASETEIAARSAPDLGDFDYELLAEKISVILPEVDYDTIVERIAANMPIADENAIAERVAESMPQADENIIADRVAEAIPLVDYDVIAERVASTIENEFDVTVDDRGIEKIASAVSAGLDYEKIARRVAELLKADESFNRVVQVPVVEKIVREETVAAAASAEKPKEKVRIKEPEKIIKTAKPKDEETEMTTRYKRSFIARIIQSENEVKEYYGELKNLFLSYPKVHAQVNWSNDRFSFNGETIAKIGINGKQLCLYVALNPEEFPTTVYHQKYEGDKKMYEKTPMMVKVMSAVALKRAVRLVALLMEHNGAVPVEKDKIDYAAMYPYKTDEELLDEGLIKTSLMVKSDLDF